MTPRVFVLTGLGGWWRVNLELTHSRAFCWRLCAKLGPGSPSISLCTPNSEGRSLAPAGSKRGSRRGLRGPEAGSCLQA